MNIFHKYTRKNLVKNRARTIVTIIGIILSMTLFTAVFEGAYSGVQWLLRSEIAENGAYHAFYYDVFPEDAADLESQKEIKEYAAWQTVGWTNFDTDYDTSPYLTIVSVSDNFTDLVTVDVQDGRMPENENEIILPDGLYKLAGQRVRVGDTVTLSVGKRTANGEELGIYDLYDSSVPEEITDTQEHTYTVVGIYRTLDSNIINGAAYIGITRGSASGAMNVFFTIKNIRTFYSEFTRNQNEFVVSHSIQASFGTHEELLVYSGISANSSIMMMLYGLIAVLAVLIAFGSVSLIYNSFSISVSERTRQFGILKSLGATKRQIRQSVLYEALLLSAVGIPGGIVIGCAGIGITLWRLQDSFAKLMNANTANVEIQLVIAPAVLLAAAVVCLAVVLISAMIPAEKAVRISPIEAIRQAEDVKIKAKEVKTLKLTRKLWGFEGMMAAKNFKRNKRRYRATVVSLFISIVLFISASSFCSYLSGALSGMTSSEPETDISYYTVDGEDEAANPDEVLALLSSADGVTDSLYMQGNMESLHTEHENFAYEYLHRPYGSGELTDDDLLTYLVFVDDETFRTICKENGLNADDYFEAEHPAGVIYDHSVVGYNEDGVSGIKWYSFKALDTAKLPVTFTMTAKPEYDGYSYYESETDADGSEYLIYYPADYLDEFFNSEESNGEGARPDESKALKVEAEKVSFTVNAVVDDALFSLPSDTPEIIYPYSMRQAVFGEDAFIGFGSEINYAFLSNDYVESFDEMTQLLKDNGMRELQLSEPAASRETQRVLVRLVRVFSYGFILLISLIAAANVFNTISTNIRLRRREFAVLRSIGLSNRGFHRMLDYECLIYGAKGILYGLPVSLLISYLIYRIIGSAYEAGFSVPWSGVLIAVGSVFLVVFATMLYASAKMEDDNPIEALKNENI